MSATCFDLGRPWGGARRGIRSINEFRRPMATKFARGREHSSRGRW